jgi:hypothetical protein
MHLASTKTFEMVVLDGVDDLAGWLLPRHMKTGVAAPAASDWRSSAGKEKPWLSRIHPYRIMSGSRRNHHALPYLQ